MINDVNDLDMMIRLTDWDRVIKFDFVRRAVLESNDPKLWDMFEILNRKLLFRIRTKEGEQVEIVFSSERVEKVNPLRKFSEVIPKMDSQLSIHDMLRLCALEK